jgi:hypothetical protein
MPLRLLLIMLTIAGAVVVAIEENIGANQLEELTDVLTSDRSLVNPASQASDPAVSYFSRTCVVRDAQKEVARRHENDAECFQIPKDDFQSPSTP